MPAEGYRVFVPVPWSNLYLSQMTSTQAQKQIALILHYYEIFRCYIQHGTQAFIASLNVAMGVLTR